MLKKSLIYKILLGVGLSLLPLFISLSHGYNKNFAPQNYMEAKHAARHIFHDHRRTFYCDCPFDHKGNVQLENCGYIPQMDIKRAMHVEFEHLMPVSYFGKGRTCWEQKICKKSNDKLYKGRQCCQKIDREFALMEADLHNIVPEIGELNQLRANFQFMLLPDIQKPQFGFCHFKRDPKRHGVEPSEITRGLIARAYLYMEDTYHIALKVHEKILFRKWHQQYPPNAWEIEWDKRIFNVQGNHNRYITEYQSTVAVGEN